LSVHDPYTCFHSLVCHIVHVRIYLILLLHSVLTPFLFFFFFMIPPPPRSTLFPYTTLFRSSLASLLTCKVTELSPFKEPDITLSRRFFSTGFDSPVKEDSSNKPLPLMIKLSTGTISPGLTTILSPTLTSLTLTSSMSPSSIILWAT